MPKLDKLLELMSSRGSERALMVSDESIQLYVGQIRHEGPLLSGTQLGAVIEEVLPADMQPVYRNGVGSFHFVYHSPRGNYDLDVANVKGILQVSISPVPTKPTVSPVPATPTVTPAPATPIATPTPVPDVSIAKSAGELISRPAPKAAVVPTASNDDFISSPWSSSAPTDETASPVTATDPDYCILHPTERAAGFCEYSGKPYCRDCLVEINGRFYGKENLDRAMASGSASTTKPAPISSPHGGPTANVTTVEVDDAPFSNRSRIIAGLLGIFLGVAGAHRIYLGYTIIGIAIPVIAFVLMFSLHSPITMELVALWGFIEGIVILAGGMKDARGRALRKGV